ncbi:hypothetical protein G7072_09150 [Nocardioides sp. HDW12B]|uniref:hypothetical protein n=1 Tax=Nocardioides sp. HDW12B TaxID=2714939 RepID=UPI00140AD3B1|nr:hypothetical protein [Nocardioides sp. HDW12B]QIK66495.1 hypothetical protein G7072_09150 [Nocardioides sp. HDW12B]
MAAQRVYLHVGAPKSGTTYLQARLAANARSLARRGVQVPTPRRTLPRSRAHFQAALDLLDQDWGGPPGHAVGAWPRLLDAVDPRAAAVVVSHEILAPAPATVVRRALADLAGARGTRGTGTREVHVVLTAREPSGALASAWQESLKQGRRWSFARFLDLAESRRGWWYHALDLPAVLGTWSADLPPERVHLVTVPPVSGGQDELWRRFCEALACDPSAGPRRPEASNPSLGVVEAAVLRRLNETSGRERADDLRAQRIDTLLGPGGLEERRSPRLGLPPGRRRWAAGEADRWHAWLTEHPVTVHGSLADLLPAPAPPADTVPDPADPADPADPDAVPDAVLLERAAEVQRSLDLAGSGHVDSLRRRTRLVRDLLRGDG